MAAVKNLGITVLIAAAIFAPGCDSSTTFENPFGKSYKPHNMPSGCGAYIETRQELEATVYVLNNKEKSEPRLIDARSLVDDRLMDLITTTGSGPGKNGLQVLAYMNAPKDAKAAQINIDVRYCDKKYRVAVPFEKLSDGTWKSGEGKCVLLGDAD